DPMFQSIWSGPLPSLKQKVYSKHLKNIYTGGYIYIILSTSCNYMNITPNELDGYDLYGELSIRTMDGNRYTVDFGAIAWIDENGEVKLENFNLVGDPVLNNY
ncbi:MAG: hypothetical protein IJA06_03920, partial [Oscillospiraceae bacterium]|nr:hypothetical protein [Oscillospiraceae bacterium]